MQRSSWVLPLLCLSAFGCSFTTDMARSEFSRQYSCPEERLAVKTVPVSPETLLAVGEPPADVVADAARLALWRANRVEDMQTYWHLSAVDVTGCGTRKTYLCWDVHDKEHDTIDTYCNAADLTDPNTKLGEFQVNPEALQAVREQLQ
jgi:hypothetical protein